MFEFLRRPRRPSIRPRLEALEDRTAPATLTWSGAGASPYFSDAANWGGHAPRPGDTLVFGPGAAQQTANNDLGNVPLRSIRFEAAGYTLTGGRVRLQSGVSASAEGLNTVGCDIGLIGVARVVTFDVGANAQLRLGGTVSGSSRVTLSKVGAGTLTLGGAGDNANLGKTVVAGGGLELDRAGGLAVGGNLIVHAGATVKSFRDDQLGDTVTVAVGRAGAFFLDGQHETVAKVVLTGGSIATGEGTLETRAVLTTASDVPASISGHLGLRGGFRQIFVADGAAADDLVISAAIHDGGLYKTGPGKLVLSGASDYTGISVVVTGTLEARSNAALGGNQYGTDVFPQGSLVLGGNITLDEPLNLLGAGDRSAGSLQGLGAGNVVTSVVRLPAGGTVGTDIGSELLLGVVAGPGRLVKVGPGTVRLGAATLHTGGTVIAAGVLETVNPDGVTTQGLITVASGGVLTGGGEVQAVTVSAGGTLAPGATVGVLKTGAVRFMPRAFFRADLYGAVPTADLLDVSGTVNLGGATLVLHAVPSGASPEEYLLIANDGTDPVVGTFAGLPEGKVLSLNNTDTPTRYRISYVAGTGNDVALTFETNSTPIAEDGAGTTAEDTAFSGQLAATDPEGDGPITYSVVTGAATGTVVLNRATGAFTYTPAANFFGTDSFTFRANDGVGDGNTATFTITVTEVNERPIAVNDAVASSPEDTVYTILGTALTANDSRGPVNESNQTLTVTAVSNVVGGAAVVIDGNVQFTPAANFFGAASFDYTVTDDGTTNGQPAPLTGTAHVTFTVTAVNDAPVAADDTRPSVAEDSAAFTILGTALTANDSRGPANESNQTLTVTAVSNVVGGTATVVAGNVRFTPAANFNGTASFDYTVRDNGTTAGVADPRTDVGHVSFTITAVNDAPVASNDTLASRSEDSEPVTILGTVLTSNDSRGPEDEGGQALTIISVANAVGGTAVVVSGSVLFIPAVNFNGTASFDYTVRDNGTTAGVADPRTDVGRVSFPITAVNDAPVAADDAIANCAEDNVHTFLGSTLTANDSDGPANESAQTLTVTAVSNVVGGTATVVAGNVQFTPAANFFGAASFDYTVTDNGTTDGAADPRTDVGRATFKVTEVNDAPVATDDTLATRAEDSGAFSILAATLLADDSAGPANESAQTLTLTAVSNAVGGTVELISGNIRFTPAANFNGTASFDYTVRDNGTTAGVSAPRTDVGHVTFTITAVNDPPLVTASAGNATVVEDATVVVDPGITLTDVDDADMVGATVRVSGNFIAGADSLSFTASGGVTGSYNSVTGVLTLTGVASKVTYRTVLRSVRFTSSTPGTKTITFTVNDGEDTGSDTRNVVVTVRPPF